MRDAAFFAAPITAVFADAARRWPDAPYLVSRSHPDESVTFAQFLDQARRVATFLARAGVGSGDRVVLIGENRPRWCVAHAGVLLAGATVVPVDAQAPGEALEAMLADCGARHVIASATLLERITPIVGASVRRHALDDGDAGGATPWSALQADRADLPDPAGGDAIAALLYTSGTTGLPKGCVLTHANLRHELHAIDGVALGADDTILQFLPLHHVLAQVGTYIAPADIGMRVVHATIRKSEDLSEALRDGGITVLLAVPQLFHVLHDRVTARLGAVPWPGAWLLRAALAACRAISARAPALNPGRVLFAPVRRAIGPHLRLLVSGGAALDPRVQADFLGLGFAIIQAYGLTETSGGALADDPRAPRAGTVGRPLPGVTLRIDSPDATGVGEVCLRGPLVTPGYHDRPDDTAAILQAGWLMTGDLGRLDGAGRLVLVGRSKEIIVLASGKNVNPEEIEAAYARSPWISELCVMARRPEGGGAERLHAVVVPDWARFRQAGAANVREAIRFQIQEIALGLPAYQRITSFELRREALPRTATRKLQRFKVASGEAAAPEAAIAPDPRTLSGQGARLAAILRRRAGSAVLSQDAHLELDLGLSSLERMEVALALEAEMGVGLTDDELARAATVGQLLDLVERAGSPGATGARAASGSWSGALADASDADLPASLARGRSALDRALLRGLLAVARGVARVAFRLRAEGLEHLPSSGPMLICPNHVSFLDGFLVGCTLPWRLARIGFVLGEAAYVQNPVARPLARIAGVVPVDPARHLRAALRAGAAGLKRGFALVLFPEGERSADGRLQEIRAGAPILAAELGVPIVPVVVAGAFEAWPRGRRWPRPRPVTVRFGAPLDPAAVIPPDTPPDEAHRLLASALERALVQLGAPEPGSPATPVGAPGSDASRDGAG